MYIEIEPAQRAIPQISLKRDRRSNVIKKSELRQYQEAQSLLESLKGRVSEYQSILEQEVLQLIEEKELALNAHITQVFSATLESWNTKQSQWFTEAEDKLSLLLTEQNNILQALKDELRCSMVGAVQSRLVSFSKDDALIQYLVDALHSEIDDVSRGLKVDKITSEGGVTLSVENDERLIRINTSEIIEQLRKSLDVL